MMIGPSQRLGVHDVHEAGDIVYVIEVLGEGNVYREALAWLGRVRDQTNVVYEVLGLASETDEPIPEGFDDVLYVFLDDTAAFED